MQQINAKINEKNEKNQLFSLRNFVNQTVFFQRILFDNKVKLKRRFKFLIITLIKILNCFFRKVIRYFCKFRNQIVKTNIVIFKKFFFRDD